MNTFGISSRVDCAIQINFNLDAVDKGGSFYIGNDLSPSRSFILGKFYVIWVNVNTMRIHSGVKSVQSAMSDLKRPPERLQSQCNYQPFIT